MEWVQESRSAFAYVSTQPESFPWDQAQVRKTPVKKNAPPIFFQTCLEAYVLPRTALELTVAIFPLIGEVKQIPRVNDQPWKRGREVLSQHVTNPLPVIRSDNLWPPKVRGRGSRFRRVRE